MLTCAWCKSDEGPIHALDGLCEECHELRLRMGPPSLSNRGREWLQFAAEVLHHIETYTVPQYGDAPEDQVQEWSPDQCVLAIRKYGARWGHSSREDQDDMDLKKMAHYAAIAWGKRCKTSSAG